MTTVIWDWNGTLLNDLNLVVSINNQMLEERNLPQVTTQFYLDQFDFPVVDYYKKCGFDLEKEPFPQIAAEYMERYMEDVLDCSLHEGIKEILDRLAQNGVQQFILSAKQQDLLRETVPHYNIENYFLNIAGIKGVTAEGKIERGKELIEKYDIDPTNCFFIGDTTHDYAVAHEFGFKAILQIKGHHAEARLRKCPCPVVKTHSEITNLILNP